MIDWCIGVAVAGWSFLDVLYTIEDGLQLVSKPV